MKIPQEVMGDDTLFLDGVAWGKEAEELPMDGYMWSHQC